MKPRGVVFGNGGSGVIAARKNVVAKVPHERDEFAACGSKSELFWFELALWHDHKIHGRRQ